MSKRRRTLLLCAAALAGCSLPGQGPAPREYRLTPKTTFPPGLRRAPWSLAIAEPVAERALDTNRIAVVEDGVRLDYLADALWADRAPALVQNLIVQSFVRADVVTAVGTDRDRLRADFLLRSALRAFQAGNVASGPAAVRVGIDAELLRLPRREPVARESLTAEATPAARRLDAIVLAFDEALGAVLKDLVLWTVDAGGTATPAG